MNKSRLEKFYENVVAEDTILLYNFTNLGRIPKIKSAILSSTSSVFGKSKISAAQSFSVWRIQSSQKCKDTRAGGSIAFGNLRKGALLGLKTTLRKRALFHFFDKTALFVLPKIDNLEMSCIPNRIGITPSSTLSFYLKSSAPKDLDNYEKEILSGTTNQKVVLNKLPTFLKKSKEKPIDQYNKIANSLYRATNFSLERIEDNKSLFFFTIGARSCTFFPEGNLLSIFFDSTPGFSLSFSCTKIGSSSFLRGSAARVEESYKFCNLKSYFSRSLRQSLRNIVVSTNREEHVKNQFASAFRLSKTGKS